MNNSTVLQFNNPSANASIKLEVYAGKFEDHAPRHSDNFSPASLSIPGSRWHTRATVVKHFTVCMLKLCNLCSANFGLYDASSIRASPRVPKTHSQSWPFGKIELFSNNSLSELPIFPQPIMQKFTHACIDRWIWRWKDHWCASEVYDEWWT